MSNVTTTQPGGPPPLQSPLLVSGPQDLISVPWAMFMNMLFSRQGPRALVYQFSANQNLTNGVNAILTFDTAAFNIGSIWAIGQPTKLTAPVTGLYLVEAQWRVFSSLVGVLDIQILVNGGGTNPVREVTTPQVAGMNVNQQISSPMQLNANDVITFQVNETVANTTTVVSSTWASLTLLTAP